MTDEKLDLGGFDSPLLVFGGPYGNLAVTEAMRVRAHALGIPPQRVICSGDLVAYCAQPAATVDLIRDWGIAVVMGNCEESLGFSEPDCGCGFAADSSCSTLAVTWYRYADARVGAAQREWMRALPRALEFDLGGMRFRVIHGSLERINEFVFASSDPASKTNQVRRAGVDAIIGGHSGIPFGQALDQGWWLNAGVIGMPANDGSPLVWYLLLEPEAGRVRATWHRLEYDFETSRRSTIAAGMPEYGHALGNGLWPSLEILPEAERATTGQPLDLPPLVMQSRVAASLATRA